MGERSGARAQEGGSEWAAEKHARHVSEPSLEAQAVAEPRALVGVAAGMYRAPMDDEDDDEQLLQVISQCQEHEGCVCSSARASGCVVIVLGNG